MIKVYDAFTDDFSGQGLGYIAPVRADVQEEARGLYEIEVEVPINESRDDYVLVHENIIAAPAPTRTSPELNFGISGTIQRQIYKASKSIKMYNLKNRKKVLQKYKKNAEFVRMSVDGEWYEASAVKGGATGWIKAESVVFSRDAEDAVDGDSASAIVENVIAREQLFRIYGIRRDIEKMRITAFAEHISYDLRGVICASEYAPENIPADEVTAQIMARADTQDHPFRVFCQCTTPISGDYSGRNIIDCLLNTDDGIVTQCGARFIRDNFDIYILDPADRYMGVDIRYGDNMIKAVEETDSSARISRIRPVGKNKKGNPLYITDNDGYVDSPDADRFAVKRTKQIEYAEAQTGKNGLSTDAQTRKKLAELAAAEFEKGADGITAKIDTSFIRKELAKEYTDLANEAALHLYDVTRIRAKRAGIAASVRMSAYTFSALPNQERYTDTRITDIAEYDAMIYGGNIAKNSVSGTLIRNNSIDAAQKIKDLTVGYGKFDQAAIDQLSVNSITAVTGAFNNLTVNDTLYAAFANVIKLAANSIAAGNITTDQLATNLAEVITLHAGTGEFDLATIQNLLSNALVLQQGQAGSMNIINLAVTSANLLNATVGELVLKGSDGLYYRVYIGSDGTIHTQTVTVSQGEIEAGQTSTGSQIVETTANIRDLNTQNIKGESAIIDSIVTTALTAGKITATEALIASATIPTLYTTAIKAIGDGIDLSANKYIQFVVGEVNKKSETYRQEDAPEDAEYGDMWVQPSTGYTYQLSGDDIPDNLMPSISIDEDGNMVYEFSDDQAAFELSINDDGDLVYADTTYMLQVNDDGVLVPNGQWVRVVDNDAYDQISGLRQSALSKEEFQYYMRFDTENALVIGRSDSPSKAILNNEGLSVNVNGSTFSKFAGNYAQFGKWQMRLSAKGALIFKLARE